MSPQTPKTTPTARALLVTALAVLVVVGAAAATPWQFQMPDIVMPDGPTDLPKNPAPPQPTGLPPERPPGPHDAGTLGVVLAVLVTLALATLMFFVARRILRSLRGPVDDDPDTLPTGDSLGTDATPAIPLAELQDAVQRALSRVDAAATPHDAVVAAWVALEDAAAEHGTTRDPAQTPTEFTSEILAATPAPPAELDTLRHLYGQARFTSRAVSTDQVADARDALRRIADALDEDAR